MPIVYSWVLDPLNVKPVDGTLSDVVVSIDWKRIAVDGGYSAYAYGRVVLGPPNPSDYIPFSEITESEAEGWVVSALTQPVVDQYDATLAADIEKQKEPPVVPMPPPW